MVKHSLLIFLHQKSKLKSFSSKTTKKIETNFNEFISLSRYDNELSEKCLTTNEEDTSNNNNNNENEHSNNNNNDNENENDNDDHIIDNDDSESGSESKSINENEKISKTVSVPLHDQAINEPVLSLRLFANSIYRKLIEDILVSFSSQDSDDSLYHSS